jgi:hypothetical protein
MYTQEATDAKGRTVATKNATFRFSEQDLANIEELAVHLRVSKTEALRIAAFELRGKVGLHKTAGLRTVERLTRAYGDQGAVTVTLGQIPHTTVTVNGDTQDQLRAHVLVALTSIEDGPVQLPKQAQPLLVDRDTGAKFDLPPITPVEEGATVTVKVRDLPSLLRPAPDPDRSIEQRRWEARLHEMLRDAAGMPPDAE